MPIMLAQFSNAYTHLLCSKLCQYNLPTPSPHVAECWENKYLQIVDSDHGTLSDKILGVLHAMDTSFH